MTVFSALSEYVRDLWDWFDRLSDVKKVATGSLVALFLFSSWLYCLGFVGLATMSHEAIAAPATVNPTITLTATPTIRATAAATSAPIISLPANLPTERPFATAIPTSRPAPPPPPTIVPFATSGTRLPAPTPVYTATPARGTPAAGTVGPVSPTPTVSFRTTPVLSITATPTYSTSTPANPTAMVPAASTATPTRVPPTHSPTPGGR